MNLSFWELDTYFKNTGVVIAGSGIVGLNAALHLKSKSPKLKVLVLEKGILPYGASSKNAGFACFGSSSELIDDLKIHTEEQVFSLVEKRWKGLKKLRKTLGDKSIDFKQYGGYEVFDNEELFEENKNKLSYLNKHLSPIIKEKNVFRVNDKKIKKFGFKEVSHLIENSSEGQIDTGKMINSLIRKAQENGVIILNCLAIDKFEDEGDKVKLVTNQGFSFYTKKFLIATNGFAKQLLPEEEIKPARAQVLITEPIRNLKIKGVFHYDKGYYYFRNIGKRVLFGGGRNLDFRAEETNEFGITPIVQDKLESLLKNMILPGVDFKIEHRWSGIMGLGPQKTTIVKELSKNVFCGIRMGGMGVAIGSLIGEESADLVLNSL
jgi:gamma-glutamylputrescine oxidase